MKNLTNTKRVAFKLQGPLSGLLVELEIPGLTLEEAKISGDWAPEYTFNLSEKVNVTLRKNDEKESYSLAQEELSLYAPMLYKERQQTPLKTDIHDLKLGVTFHLDLNEDGNIQAAHAYMSQDLEHEHLA